MLESPFTQSRWFDWLVLTLVSILVPSILALLSLISPLHEIRDLEATTYPLSEMGAVPTEVGTVFRVWAPHADQVSVIGSFTPESEIGMPLQPEPDGYWSGLSPEAQVGDQYNFRIVNNLAGKTLVRIDPYARHVTSSVGRGIIESSHYDWGSSLDFKPVALNEMVIYEIHVGTFNDAPGDPPGTFASAREKLDYLQDLGVNTLKILPIAEFAGDYSWGYNPSLIFAVESAYGGPQAFKDFVKAAHEHGLAVILDTVYNHLGPSDLDLWQFDGWSPHPHTGGSYFYNSWRARTNWAHTRPNFGLAPVRQYFINNAKFWFDDFKVDGLRWDSTVNMRTVDNGRGARLPDGISLMQEINDIAHAYTPPKIIIAEDHRDNSTITRSTRTGGLGFDAQWDPKFVHAIRDAIIGASDADRDLDSIQASVSRRYSSNGFERVIYTESHDEVANGSARVAEQIWLFHADSWESRKRSTLGAALVFTSPGIPMLFQGQELLEDHWFEDNDPLEWSRLEQFPGIHALYRDLIHLRTNSAGLTRGLMGQHLNIFHLNPAAKVLASHRWDQGGPQDDVVVVINMTRKLWDHYEIGFPQAGSWRVRFNSDWQGYGPDYDNYLSPDVEAVAGTKDGLPYHGSLRLGPWTAIILSQDA